MFKKNVCLFILLILIKVFNKLRFLRFSFICLLDFLKHPFRGVCGLIIGIMKIMQRLFLLFFCLIYVVGGYSQTLVGSITSISGDNVHIKLSSGIKSGEILEVYQLSGYMTDPVTKRRVRKEVLLGTLEVKKVFSEYAIASSYESEIFSKLKVGMNVKKGSSSVIETRDFADRNYEHKSTSPKTKNDFMLDAFVVSSGQVKKTDNSSPIFSKFRTNKDKQIKEVKEVSKGLKQLRKRGSSIYIMSHIPDSITGVSIKKELSKRFNRNGYWNTTNDLSEADMVLNFYGYIVNDGECVHLYSYALMFDQNFQFLYRTKAYKLCGGFEDLTEHMYKSFCGKIKDDICNAKIKKNDFVQKKKVSQQEFDRSFLNANKSMQNHDYKDAKKYYLKCIELDPEQWQLYETLGYCCAELEDYKDAIKYFDKYLEYDPTNTSLDNVYGMYKGLKIQKSIERSMKIAQITGIVSTAVAGATAIYAASSGKTISSGTSHASNVQQTSVQNSSRVAQETCSYCQGTGINPVATSAPSFSGSGEKYCDHCKAVVSSSHGYHGTCPSCRGKGYVMRVKW